MIALHSVVHLGENSVTKLGMIFLKDRIHGELRVLADPPQSQIASGEELLAEEVLIDCPANNFAS